MARLYLGVQMRHWSGKAISRLYVLTQLALLLGCASVSSKVQNSEGPIDDGIVYYMPMRPIKVSVAVGATANVQTATVTQTDTADTVADVRHRFVLSYEPNLVGKNHLGMSVSAQGLLESSNQDTTSGVTTIAQNLAKAAGDITAIGAKIAPLAAPAAAPGAAPPPPQNCQPNQVYTMLLFPEQPEAKQVQQVCSFSVSIASLWNDPTPNPDRRSTTRLGNIGTSQAGVFYRHDLPYIVSVRDANNTMSKWIAYSPDESGISFVPVTRTLFSDNNTQITLVDGVLKSVDETASGELVALSELPADILSAYFSAIGSMFTAFGSNSSAQTTEIANAQALAVAKIKQQACRSAIAANNLSGLTGAALSAAVANVTAACS
jgi:hypothetical protein